MGTEIKEVGQYKFKKQLSWIFIPVAVVLIILWGTVGQFTLPFGLTKPLPTKFHYALCEHGLLYGSEGSDPNFLAVCDAGGRWGYCDRNGNIVIKPQYADAMPFYEGLAAVKKGGRWGYIDTTGKVAIPFKFLDAYNFHNGRAFVSTGDNPTVTFNSAHYYNSRIISRSGHILAETEYVFVNYSDGLYRAESPIQTVFLDSSGVAIFGVGHAFPFGGPSDFHEGLANVQPMKNLFEIKGPSYYIDKSGKRAFPDTFWETKSFSGGLAAVRAEEDGLWGYIDKTGKMVIPPVYLAAGPFGEGLACVETAEGRWIIIDSSGRERAAIEEDYTIFEIGAFSEGMCVVKRGFGCEYIDTTGKYVIKRNFVRTGQMDQFPEATPFKNGIAQVKTDDGIVTYIDKTGKYLWEPK